MGNKSNYERMAMLDMPQAERSVIHERFDAVCNCFTKIEQYETDDTLPLITVLDDKNIMREDISTKVISREELLGNSPEQQDGYIRVPGAID